ncbi:hypothetical protein CsSME_00023592 [Camellia sinensis var. sinensis]
MAVGSYYYCVWPSSSSSSISPLRKLPYSSSLASSSCHCCRSSPSHSLSPVNTTLSHIKNTGVIACLRAQSAELAMEAACAALNGGISVLEIVMSTPGVFEVLQQLVQDYPTTTLGVTISLLLLVSLTFYFCFGYCSTRLRGTPLLQFRLDFVSRFLILNQRVQI